MTHMIRQQHLKVAFQGTEPELAALQQRLQRFCRDSLLPAIEVALDRHSTTDQHLYLERLDLDVGQLPVERLEYDLAASVTEALERTLNKELSRTRATQRKSSQQAFTEAFLYFLEAGSLPWWFRLPPGCDLEQGLVDCWQARDPSGSVSRTLQETAPRLFAAASARRRLLLQFSHPFLGFLLALVSPEVWETANAVFLRLEGLPLPEVALKLLRENVWERTFAAVARGGGASERELAGSPWRSPPFSALLPSGMAEELAALWPETRGKGRESAGSGAGPTGSAGSGYPAAGEEPGLIRSRDGAVHPEAAEGIYIDNAGLVLLHPFLPQCFEALRIAQGGKLLQPERAVCLLHHLAAGSVKAPEYLVTLPKVLCNIGLQEAVSSEAALTSAEQGECAALLEAVIRHWGALGSCSPDALRGTFLVRPGKLTLRRDGEWLLQVESSGCDILLDELPWSISMIRLPWMGALLWVEWT